MFWQNEEFAVGLGRDICLDSVLCVVDAMFGTKVQLVCLKPNIYINMHGSKWKKIMLWMASAKAYGKS
jgi:hypothetical protein